MITPTLSIADLRLAFRSWMGESEVLHGISLDVKPGETVALVGESGSGKSVTARLVLGLLQEQRNARVTGQIHFAGRDLGSLAPAARRQLRGTEMSMIFQDPTSALNPTYRIGALFQEVLRRAEPGITADAALSRAGEALHEVSIADPPRVLASYAFQLSGGMNQRVMIAMALANRPKLLLADEPGTALDVTVQAQTLKLMADLVARQGTSVLFISHNLGVVREIADRVYVIYRGTIVESGQTAELFAAPRHPYTRALLAAVPRLTGGGIPEIEDDPALFSQPAVTYEAAR